MTRATAANAAPDEAAAQPTRPVLVDLKHLDPATNLMAQRAADSAVA